MRDSVVSNMSLLGASEVPIEKRIRNDAEIREARNCRVWARRRAAGGHVRCGTRRLAISRTRRFTATDIRGEIEAVLPDERARKTATQGRN